MWGAGTSSDAFHFEQVDDPDEHRAHTVGNERSLFDRLIQELRDD